MNIVLLSVIQQQYIIFSDHTLKCADANMTRSRNTLTFRLQQSRFPIKCSDLNRVTFSWLNIEEKVYLFKSAHFIVVSLQHVDQKSEIQWCPYMQSVVISQLSVDGFLKFQMSCFELLNIMDQVCNIGDDHLDLDQIYICLIGPHVPGNLQYLKPTLLYSAAQGVINSNLNFKNPSTSS